MEFTKTTPVSIPMSDAEKADIKSWQKNLIRLGFVMLGVFILLQVAASLLPTTVTEDKTTTNKTITTTDGVAVPSALVTTCLGGAVLLFLGGAFYGRITKFSWNGIEVGLSDPAAKAVEEKAKDVATSAQNKTPETEKKLADLAKDIALVTNLRTTLSPEDLAEVSVDAAARQLNLQ